MNGGYTNFTAYLDLEHSLPHLLRNDQSAISLNSGTSFPSSGVVEGMPCLRTDERILYIYSDYKQRPFLKFDENYNVTTNALEETNQSLNSTIASLNSAVTTLNKTVADLGQTNQNLTQTNQNLDEITKRLSDLAQDIVDACNEVTE